MTFLSLVLTFFTFFILCNAAPFKLETRGVSSQILSSFTLYEQYSAAAYCKSNNNGNGMITCPAGNCPDVQNAGASSVLEFEDLGVTDATGFIAVDDRNKLIVLSYRGSTSLRNWLGNLDLELTGFLPCKDCQVHRGFLSSWNDSKDTVRNTLARARADHPDYSIIFTGHSLGAAIVTLAAAELRQQGFNIALYTFGSPMVGNSQFASFVTNQNGGNYRVTHKYDTIPKLPGYMLNYRHVSPEYWITTGNNQRVGPGDIKSSSGTLNLWGNQGTLFSSVGDHFWYFNPVAACSSGFEF